MDAKTLCKPITKKELAAFMRSSAGKNQFVQRMANTIREQWMLLAPPPETTVVEDAAQAEADWQSYERVLIVSTIDGVSEVFSEPWVAVRHVEVKPWEDRDSAIEGLPDHWKRLDYPVKSKFLIVPRLRVELDEKNLRELVLWSKRAEAFQALAQWKANREADKS
jgi:hypothetical protein